jgi:hypothetical protein
MTAMERIAGLAPKRGPPAERIDIIHFDLAGSIADIPPGIPGTEVLIIFWRGDIPAGHAPDSIPVDQERRRADTAIAAPGSQT